VVCIGNESYFNMSERTRKVVFPPANLPSLIDIHEGLSLSFLPLSLSLSLSLSLPL